MNNSEIIYVGVHGHVLAVHKLDGTIVWQTKIKKGFLGGGAFVTVLVEGNRIFAHTNGELHCLDAMSGQILWKNPLDGLGYDLASLAVQGTTAPSQPIVARIQQQRAEQSSSSNNSSASNS